MRKIFVAAMALSALAFLSAPASAQDVTYGWNSVTASVTVTPVPVLPHVDHWKGDYTFAGANAGFDHGSASSGPALSTEARYQKNLRDSGYDPKRDFDGNGIMVVAESGG